MLCLVSTESLNCLILNPSLTISGWIFDQAKRTSSSRLFLSFGLERWNCKVEFLILSAKLFVANSTKLIISSLKISLENITKICCSITSKRDWRQSKEQMMPLFKNFHGFSSVISVAVPSLTLWKQSSKYVNKSKMKWNLPLGVCFIFTP